MISIIGRPFPTLCVWFFVFNFAMTLMNNELGTMMFNWRFVNFGSFF